MKEPIKVLSTAYPEKMPSSCGVFFRYVGLRNHYNKKYGYGIAEANINLRTSKKQKNELNKETK